MNEAVMLQVLGDVLKDHLGQPAGANRVMLEALGDVLKSRLKELEEKPNVSLIVDMTPVAAALDRMAAAVDAQAVMFARLLEAVLTRPVTVQNTILPAPVVVQAPAPVAKQFSISKDGDGKWTGQMKPAEPTEPPK